MCLAVCALSQSTAARCRDLVDLATHESHSATVDVRAIVPFAAWRSVAVGPRSASNGAFTGARVIDGTDRAPIDNATILVRDGTDRRRRPGREPSRFRPARSACRSPARPSSPASSTRTATSATPSAWSRATTPPRTSPRDLQTYAAYGITTVFSLGDDQAAGHRRPRRAAHAVARSRAPVRRRSGARAEIPGRRASSWSTKTRR